MKYKIDGRWSTLNSTKDINYTIGRAVGAYREGYYYNTPKSFLPSMYNLSKAYTLLLKMSPTHKVDIVRVSIENSNIVLVTLAIQLTGLNKLGWSSSDSMCLEELLEVLQYKDPEYHDFFINALSSGEVA